MADLIQKLADKLGELFALQEERTSAQIAAGLVETHNALRLRGSRPEQITGSRLVDGGPGRLVGWSLRAPAAAALVVFRDGRPGSGGDVVALVQLAAGGVETMTISGVSITEALSVEVTGGPVEGAAYLGAVD